MNASRNETGVDDFDLSVGAGSLKRAYDGGRLDTPGDGSSPGFDVLTTTTPSKPGAPDTTQIDKATTTGSITYTWTPLDALESATTPEGTVTYTYDGDGLRIKKTFGNDDVIYIRDGSGQIIAEYDGQGHLLAEYVYAMGRRVAKISASGMRFYYHTDNVGTPLAITDQNGNLSWRGEYLPFGSEFSSTDPGDHFKFTGKELEDHTGLYYFEARYYDPVIGRFISVDPVGGNVGNSQSWNRYVYVENNPINAFDPDGKALNFVAAGWGSLIGAVAGGGIELGRQLFNQEELNLQKVGASTAGGAATGALAGLTLGGSIVVEIMGAGAGETLGGVVDRGMDGDSSTVALNGDYMVVDAAGGMVGGGAARAIKPLVTSAGSEAGRQFVKNNPVLKKAVEKGGPAAAKAAGKAVGRAAAGQVVEEPETFAPDLVPSHVQPGNPNLDQMVRSH